MRQEHGLFDVEGRELKAPIPTNHETKSLEDELAELKGSKKQILAARDNLVEAVAKGFLDADFCVAALDDALNRYSAPQIVDRRAKVTPSPRESALKIDPL